jgi:hypothetical protein
MTKFDNLFNHIINEDWDPEKVPLSRKEPKYVEMEDGSTKLDLYDTFDKTALFNYILDNKELKNAMTELIKKRDTKTFYSWLDSLDSKVISNGDQKAYVQHVFRDEVQSYAQHQQTAN